MNKNISLREANVDDWQAIADYNSQLARETEGKILNRDTISAGVRTLLSDPRHGRYFVACLDSRIVGQLMHTREWSDWRNGEIWWLQSVYIDPAFRRRGVFRSLFHHIEHIAKASQNVVGIRLYVEQQNYRAMKVYESMGMVTAGYAVMERILDYS